MTSVLFSWLEKTASQDTKYVNICLMENYHYFYSIFAKENFVSVLTSYVERAIKRYKRNMKKYVIWSVHWEYRKSSQPLDKFWDKLNDLCKTRNPEVVSVYITKNELRKVCHEHLKDCMFLVFRSPYPKREGCSRIEKYL